MSTYFALTFGPTETISLPENQSGAAGSVTLNPDIDSLFTGIARSIALISADDLSGVNFTISGLDAALNPISETIAGPNNGTVETVAAFYKVQSVVADNAYTNLEVSTGSTGHSIWIGLRTDKYRTAFTTVLDDDDIEYTVQISPVPNFINGVRTPLKNFTVFNTSVVDKVVSGFVNLDMAANCVRFVVNSSDGGSLKFELAQSQTGIS
jgi:hypothetical protein